MLCGKFLDGFVRHCYDLTGEGVGLGGSSDFCYFDNVLCLKASARLFVRCVGTRLEERKEVCGSPARVLLVRRPRRRLECLVAMGRYLREGWSSAIANRHSD